MADTGAPWNIPFVEPTDLVRDYPAADEAQALAIAAGLTDAFVVNQVVTATDATDRTTTSSTFVTATLSAAITPTASGNVILAFWQFRAQGSRTGAAGGPALATRIVVSASAITGQEESTQSITQVGTGDTALRSSGTQLGIFTTTGTAEITFACEFRVASGSTTFNLENATSTGVLTLVEVAP